MEEQGVLLEKWFSLYASALVDTRVGWTYDPERNRLCNPTVDEAQGRVLSCARGRILAFLCVARRWSCDMSRAIARTMMAAVKARLWRQPKMSVFYGLESKDLARIADERTRSVRLVLSDHRRPFFSLASETLCWSMAREWIIGWPSTRLLLDVFNVHTHRHAGIMRLIRATEELVLFVDTRERVLEFF